ncbi:ubiquinone biosynthesis protein COQ9 [Rhodobacter viridis]|uniref:Ubiquinone biosynthesis protein COQ9 n=1 Tax=Rhodobacter viridis TaxID=1054202 RepID=A0A318U8F5_9RHOB|nr:COQ9 family protein [Rhodobacter viridis]PYF11155.1 ubiquinone biosynthesis protein COQ9 [Rhodobacter viridis]
MKNDHLEASRLRADLLEAITPHVPFDGWSDPAFAAAVTDLGVDPTLARLVCPRGAIDLAAEYHRAADRALAAALKEQDFQDLRFRDKVAAAVKMRIGMVDAELVRRASSAFALPQNMALGGRLVWETADTIWLGLGDESRDYNWYSKRLTLSGVFSATVLFWIGDESPEHADTWAFLNHRIEDVLQFEKIKGGLLRLPGLRGFLDTIRAPGPRTAPGSLSPRGDTL